MDDQPTIQKNTTITQHDEIIAADFDDEVVIMQIEESEYYGLDSIAADVWKMLSEPQTVTEVCVRLLEKYDIDPMTCETDVLTHLNNMYEDGLVKIVK